MSHFKAVSQAMSSKESSFARLPWPPYRLLAALNSQPAYLDLNPGSMSYELCDPRQGF